MTDPIKDIYTRMPPWLKSLAVVLSLFGMLGTAWAAWDTIGLPKVATQAHVDKKIDEQITPILNKMDRVERSQYTVRIESKEQHREFLVEKRRELSLRLRQAKDLPPDIASEMEQAIADLDRRIRINDQQVDSLKDQRRLGGQGPN